ncbi:MAG TPA: FAD-dependent oxidoreductase [Acidiphilium sp.]|nr:MAG: choline dehydrogenase [Acidiphilium sp. 21-60-14]OYV90463.1 MAG: choline dehydrogenase [Acidiphilium sp. 37-60-79]OZB38824.1 MAG: choline dehydrogenase [Acidiphilium sp. 34-60-192]HQT87727.1 FAD-dependent oxidoreductase [Acidiphilium sp.]HQU22854.1 FAD-dependent oxidoreductase [Acidiphilium sp.]
MSHYVIVGAGSAGCVLAARLSEDPAVQVTLIEAGGPDSAQEIHIPAAFPQLFKSEYDWDFSSEPEPGLAGRRIYLPRGKMLGGSSSMNAMVYIRGNRADYDGWAAEGATGWGFNDVLAYFRRAENNERGEDQFHGKLGPLSVCEGRSRNPLMDAFVQAGVQAGYPANPDFNAAEQDGVGLFQNTQRNGMRCSTAVAYLHPAMARPNLRVITDALTTRILFDGTRASGVEIVVNGQVETIHAEQEVILAAGAYNSPQLLMLSGIGPAADLAAFQIPVRADLPVGVGLQDHPMTLMTWYTNTETLMTAATAENVELLTSQGRGPLTSNIGEAGGFFRTRDGLDAPDVQFHAAPVMFYQEGMGVPTAHAFGFGPCVLKPTSRGKLSLRSANPRSKPRITHNYFATAEDRASALEGMRIGLEIAKQPALQAHITGPHQVPASESDADLWDYIERYTHTVYHPTSTCAIGPVVDPALRVHGVQGLRVVDASVMPSVVRGNTNAPTIMIAERAADLIRGAAS